MSNSTLESLLSLNAEQRQSLLATLNDEQAASLLYDWELWARQGQLEPPGDWRIWLVLAGRGYGKTRVGAEWMREQVKTYPLVNMIGATTDDVRDIMVEGESGIMAVCPPWERPVFRPSLMRLDWPNGAKTLYFTAEKPERLRGKQHMRLWADELAAWQYVDDTWDMAVLGLRLGDDPRALITTTPKPIPLLRELITDETVAITKGATYENRDNLAPTFFSQLIKKYEGTRLGRQELDAELLLDEGLAYRVIQDVHIVPTMKLPASFMRRESMDHGVTNPTAWLLSATDYDGNVIVADEYYAPGLPDEHAKEVRQRRGDWWEARDADENLVSHVCYGDPASLRESLPARGKLGEPITLQAIYQREGIVIAPGNNRRRAGFVEVSRLLRLDPERAFPLWHPRAGEKGAPRLYFVGDRCPNLVGQLRDAPIASEDTDPFRGEAIDKTWEGARGHAHAALRYLVLTSADISAEPVRELEDPRARLLARVERRFVEDDEFVY